MSRFRLFLVAHTHFDAEVFISRERTLEIGSDNILDVLHLLDTDPDYRYTLDQRAYLEGFARRFPEELPRLRAHVDSGRLEIAGGMHVMPDANLPSGESLVRQLLYGREYLHDVLGSRSTIGWMLDSFGHHPQMPQIMQKAGFDHYVFQRGVDADGPAAFRWVGIDGTSIHAEWLPLSYGALGTTEATLAGFTETIEQLVMLARPYAADGRYLVLGGLDLSAPEHHLPELARRYNRSQDAVELIIANASDYFSEPRLTELPERHGDLNPIFTGCYTSRIALKQLNRRAESTLLAAEKLGAIAWAEHGDLPAPLDDEAWEPVLFNQFHDLICGSHLDQAYRASLARVEAALVVADRAVDEGLEAIGDLVATDEAGIPLLVFNPSAFARRDVARCRVACTSERLEAVALFAADGSQLPLQLEDVHRHPDGSLKRADVLFIADLPPLGYATFFLREATAAPLRSELRFDAVGPRPGVQWGGLLKPDDGIVSNEHIDLNVDLRTGAIRSLVFRELDWDIVDRSSPYGFATVARQEDRGDPWEYYGPLRPGTTSRIPLTDDLPLRGRALFSDEYGAQATVTGGPVAATIEITGPLGTGSLVRRFRLYAGLPRVEIETEIVNQEQFVRYRSLLPLAFSKPSITYEIPFGAIERPPGEFPSQNWVDVGDGERGVALLNRGTPGHSLVGSTLSASLLKCTRVVSYEGGGYDPGSEDSLGFEIGVRHRFEQALLPHAGDWRAASLPRAGAGFNEPFLVRKLERHAGRLPAVHGFVSVAPANVALHSCRLQGDELVLRVSETGGAASDAELRFAWPVEGAWETDLAGTRQAAVEAGPDGFGFTLGPFEIRTYAVTLGER